MSVPREDLQDSAFVVAGCKPWNRQVFDEVLSRLPGFWTYISNPAELSEEKLQPLNPKILFFLHWSWKVPEEIVQKYECVCFHMTDLPFGRGGSPLQHLILRGLETTKLTALRMTQEFDAGPVYLKRDLPLNGSAEEIYIRSSHLAAEMIRTLLSERPIPQPQEGAPTTFKRRQPSESRIDDLKDLRALFDFIRMLDAEGYPHAFMEQSGFRFEFRKAVNKGYSIDAEVKITKVDDNR